MYIDCLPLVLDSILCACNAAMSDHSLDLPHLRDYLRVIAAPYVHTSSSIVLPNEADASRPGSSFLPFCRMYKRSAKLVL